MTTRRGFLSLLATAPVAAPTLVKAAVEEMQRSKLTTLKMDWKPLSAGPAIMKREGFAQEVRRTVSDDTITVSKLNIEVDTSALKTLTTELEGLTMDAVNLEHQRLGLLGQTKPADQMSALIAHRLVYLGSPYTKYAAGIDAAFRDVSAIAADLLREGVKVYSPIAHTHPIAVHGNIDPLNHDIWLPFDSAMMDAADAMCIAEMDGWESSYGVAFEIRRFRDQGKPIYYRKRDGSVRLFI